MIYVTDSRVFEMKCSIEDIPLFEVKCSIEDIPFIKQELENNDDTNL